MSYGYVQGEEAQALAYYKKLLEVTSEPEERAKLEEIVKFLESIVPKERAGFLTATVPNNFSMAA
jgi:hypothetical protein